MSEIYQPAAEEQYAVEWFAERGMAGYADSVDALRETYEDLVQASTSPIVNRTLASVNDLLRLLYTQARQSYLTDLSDG